MSPIELTTSTPNWKGLEGTILDGGYELRELLEADESSASFRVRVLGDYTQRASATFYRAESDGEKDQVAIWDTLRQLRDQNLNGPVATGVKVIVDVPTEYVVLPAPDEMLGGVLQHRALTEEEAREVMNSTVRALERLHANGFVHGRVSPERIVSAGAAIQLTTVGVRRINSLPPVNVPPGKYLAPESVEQNTTAAADVWCLGATLLETLTRVAYAPQMDFGGMQLSAGFRRVIESCLEADPQNRCGLADISQLYRQAPLRPRRAQPTPAATVATVATVAAPTPAEPVVPAETPDMPKQVALGAAAAAGPAARVPVPPMESPTLPVVETGTEPHPATTYDGPILVHRPAADRREPGKTEERGIGKAWIYSGIGVLILFAIFLLFRGRHTAKQPTVSTNGPAAATSTAARNKWETRTLAPDNAAKQPASPSGSTAANSPVPPPAIAAGAHGNAPLHGSIWRVVLYTYAHEADAQKKADSLNQKHTGLGAEVFSPTGNSGPYLVVAGGNMTRDEAVRMRRTALRMGMPHDSYIQNYNH